MISKRAQSIDSSGIRKVFDLAAKLKDPINLSIGQPDFDGFPSIKEKAHQAIDAGKSTYTVTQGIPELRAEVLEKYRVKDSGTQALITSGVSGGLLLAYFSMLDPGDEILVPDPYFCMYRDLAYLVNAKPVYYDTYPSFSADPAQIQKLITPKTRAILINSPCNPTGYAWSEEELKAVVEVASKAGIWVIYDEIYEPYVYDYSHPNCFGLYEKVLILNGFSKSHGIPGWRAGYALGPTSLIEQMTKIQQYSFVCTPSLVQAALIGEVERDTTELTKRYKEKRDLIVSLLQEKFTFVTPGGAFYLFAEAPGGDGQAFVEKAIEKGVLIVPGNVFSTKNTHFRLSFSASLDTLRKGAERLNSIV